MKKHPILVLTLFIGMSLGGGRSLAGSLEWECHGPLKGHYSTVTVSPVDPNVLYATAVEDGAYRSADGGRTWVPINNGLTSSYVWWIQPFSRDSRPWLMAGTKDGLYVSNNDGARWTKTTSPGDVDARCCGISSPSSSIIYIGTHDGVVYKSPDAGSTWAPVVTGLPGITESIWSIAIHPQNAGVVLVGLGNGAGIYRTSNGGITWTLTTCVPGFIDYTCVYGLAFDPFNPNRVFAAASRGAGIVCGLYRSQDGGVNWSGVDAFAERNLTGVTFDPLTPDTLYVGNGCFTWQNPALSRSTDGGQTWTAVSAGLDPLSHCRVAVNPSYPQVLHLSSEEGPVCTSQDGLVNPDLRFLVADPSTEHRLYTGPFNPNALDLVAAASLLGGNLDGADLDEGTADLDADGRFDAVDLVLMQIRLAEGA